MNLEPFTGPGSTSARRALWDKVFASVISARKTEGKNASVTEYEGRGTLVAFKRDRGGAVPGVCPGEEIDEITVTFSGIVACECQGSGTNSFLGTDLGDLNSAFVLPRISSTTFQLARDPLYRVTKWSPNTDCTGSIEFEHESDVLVFASCNPDTGIWTVAIQDQVDFFFAFFGQSDTIPVPAEGVCDYPTSPDLFIDGTATISF